MERPTDLARLEGAIVDDDSFRRVPLNNTPPANAGVSPASHQVADSSIGNPTSRRPSSICVVTPVGYQSGYEYPLIVWLHAGGGNEQQIRQIAPHISTRNYIHVGIRGVQATDVCGQQFDWPASSRAAEAAQRSVMAAIAEVSERYPIHARRIILAGHQSGASMACRLALASPDIFAGVVRMGGRFPSGKQLLANWKTLRQRRLPMLWQQAINGVDDDPVRLQRDIQLAQGIQAKVDVRQYLADDLMYESALRDIDRWCFDTIISPSPTDSAADAMDVTDHVPVEFSTN